MRALEKIQQEHKTCHTVIVGGDGVSYGSAPKDAPNWREKMLREVKLDPTRTHFLGKVPYEVYKKVLQVSAAHVYLTYPFVLSWSMLEAMATGCLVIGSDTEPVREILSESGIGLLTDPLNSYKVTDEVINALDRQIDFLGVRAFANRKIRRLFCLDVGVKQYSKLVSQYMFGE